MSLRVQVNSPHDISVPTPVRIEVPSSKVPLGDIVLRAASGRAFPTQRLDDGSFVAIVSGLKAGKPSVFTLEAGEGQRSGVELVATDKGLSLQLPQGEFATYHYSADWARPFLHPLIGPDGKAVTRGYPVIPGVEGETQDHPHHKSLWTAYGEVNDADDWSEGEGHAYIRHQEFVTKDSGPACGGFQASAIWITGDGAALLDEERSVHLFNVGPDWRMMDYDLTLTAAYGEVHFGDTKEGGILSVRVATVIDGNKGGRIENSEGGVSETACWGRPAAWCDYSGVIEGSHLGIAVMDHPDNLRHPTRWHVRDYGLMTTNSFAEGAFEGGETEGYRLAADQTLRFRYRVLIHRGDATTGHVAEAYASFANPPVATAS